MMEPHGAKLLAALEDDASNEDLPDDIMNLSKMFLPHDQNLQQQVQHLQQQVQHEQAPPHHHHHHHVGVHPDAETIQLLATLQEEDALSNGDEEDAESTGSKQLPGPVMLDEDGVPINDIINKFSKMFSQIRTTDDAPTRSNNTLRMREKVDMSKFEKPPVEDYGINIQQLKKWKSERMQKLLEQETSQQEVALSKVRGYMEAITKLTKLQSWWRMMGWKKTFTEYRQGRKRIKRDFFGAWKRHMVTEKMFLNYIIGKPFRAWASEVEETKRLNRLISVFFTTCIKRLKLTPQAVMAYFSQEDFGKLLSEGDRTKIRRLILSKLFFGWCNEIRTQKVFRYRASVILSRMMRKTRGPMWSKEMTLLFFHMWRRYVAVRIAYRRGEPDPIFKTPYIHQWTIYLQQLTMSRIYKRRALENGKQLLMMRSMRRWKFMMAEDRSKPKDPIATARLYYRRRLCTKLFQGWFGIVREKGRIMRNREKYFLAWKAWAPIKRRLRKIKKQTMEMMREKNLVKIFDTMTRLCKEAMGRRAYSLKVLSESMFNRKLLMCAYALINRGPNVMLIDCWRRWCIYTRNRKKYLSFVWQFRYQYHESRTKIIWNAWRDYVRFRKQTNINKTNSNTPNKYRKSSVLAADDERSLGSIGSIVSGSTLDTMDREYQSHLQGVMNNNPTSNLLNLNSFSFNVNNSSAIGNSNNSPRSNTALSSPMGKSASNLSSAPSPNLFNSNSNNQFNPAISSLLASASSNAFDPISNSQSDDANNNNIDIFRVYNPLLIPSILENAIKIFNRSRKQVYSVTSSANAFHFFCEVSAFSSAAAIREEISAISAVSNEDAIATSSELNEDQLGTTADEMRRIEAKQTKERYEQLQTAVNNLHLEEVAVAVEAGARVMPSHIQYVGKYMGDEHVPLFCYLLSSCPMYFAQRVIRHDRNDLLMDIASPLSAILMSSQVERWERRSITGRESAYLVASANQDVIGTNFQTSIIWRAVVLNLLKLRGHELALKCIKLPATRTVDEEVVEVMKRQKVSRLITIRQSIANMFGIDLSNEPNPLVVPELLTSEPIFKKGQGGTKRHIANAFDNAANMNIYELLRQYTQITGKLTSEARALRLPMVQRDDRLNHNGFLRQARADFLALRQMCLTPDQIRKQKAIAYAKELAAASKKDKIFAQKEAARKKAYAAEVAAKKKAQKELARKIALRLLPANATEDDLDYSDEEVQQAAAAPASARASAPVAQESSSSPVIMDSAVAASEPIVSLTITTGASAATNAAPTTSAAAEAQPPSRAGRPAAIATKGGRDRSVSASADGRPPKAAAAKTTAAVAAPAAAAPKGRASVIATKREVVSIAPRRFSFMESDNEADDDDDKVPSVQSSAASTPRDPSAPKQKINPLRALFTKDPTKSTKSAAQSDKSKSGKTLSQKAQSKFLYDGEGFVLVKKEGDDNDNIVARGAEVALAGAKEEHIKAMLKAATSTSIGKSVRKKTIVVQDDEDDDEGNDEDSLASNSTDASSMMRSVDSKTGKPIKEDNLALAAKLKAQAKMKALKNQMGDGNWEEDSIEGDEGEGEDGAVTGRVTEAGDTEREQGDNDEDDDDNDDDDDNGDETERDRGKGGKGKAAGKASKGGKSGKGKGKGKGKGGKAGKGKASKGESGDENDDDEGDDGGGGEDDGDDDVGADTEADADADGDADGDAEGKESKAATAKPKAKKSKGAKKAASTSGKSKSSKGGKSGKGNSVSPKKSRRSPSPKPVKKHKSKAIDKLMDRNIRNEEFGERAKSFTNLLLETWRCNADRSIESVRKILTTHECNFARFVTETLLVKFLYDGGMQQPSNPPPEAHGGLGGWILRKALSDISFITAEVFVLFIPHNWWKVPCMYERLDNEYTLVNALNAAGKARISMIESKDVLIQDQQRDATNYLKHARREVAAIGAKRFQILQEDLGQSLAMKRLISKCKGSVVKANSQLQSFRDTIKKGEALLAAQDFDAVFELFGEGAGYNENVVDLAKIGARAVAVIEKQQLMLPKLFQRIVDSEAAVRKAEQDLKNFEKSAARVQEMLRRFGEGRFNVVIDVQQIINSIMPSRMKYDEEIETEAKVLKGLASYKKMLGRLTKKLHEKGDVMQEELKELAASGTDADVYAIMYRFQQQNIEARRKAEELEAAAAATADALANLDDKKADIYADLFGADDLVADGEGDDAFPDDLSENSHDSFRNFGAPMSGSLPPPLLGMTSRQGSMNLMSRQSTFGPGVSGALGVSATPMELSRIGSVSGKDMLGIIGAPDAGELVDGNNLSDELKAKLNMSGKSRRQKMKAMEEHLKEVADAIAAEQARQDLRARTFDEYWICIGPSDKKPKIKRAKSASGKSTPSMKSAPTSPSGESTKEPSFFDTYLKNPEPVKESLTLKLWRSTSRATIPRQRRRKTIAKFKDDADDDLYDDFSVDTFTKNPSLGNSSTVHGHITVDNEAPDDPEFTMDNTYVFANPAMWSSVGSDAFTSISLSKTEMAASFEDAGKGAPKKRGQQKTLVQDAFANVGASELARLRASRNRVDKLHLNEGLLGDPFAEGEDESDAASLPSNVSESEHVSVNSTTALSANISLKATDVDPNNPTMLIHTAIMNQDGSKPAALNRNSVMSTSFKRKMDQLDPANFALVPEEIASLKRVPPAMQQMKRENSTSRKASIAPSVEPMPEEGADDEEAEADHEREKQEEDPSAAVDAAASEGAAVEVSNPQSLEHADSSQLFGSTIDGNDVGDQSPSFIHIGEQYVPSSTNMAHRDKVETYIAMAEGLEAEDHHENTAEAPTAVHQEVGKKEGKSSQAQTGERKVHFNDQFMDDSVGVLSESEALSASNQMNGERRASQDSLRVPLGHNALDSDPYNCQVPDEDELSEITADDRSKRASIASIEQLPLIPSVVESNVSEGLATEENIDDNRSDITDSDNEDKEEENARVEVAKPIVSIVVSQQIVAPLSQEAVDFRKDAQSIPRTALENSKGPVVNVYDSIDGNDPDALDFAPIDIEDMADVHRREQLLEEQRRAFAQADEDGIAVLENGEWMLLPTSTGKGKASNQVTALMAGQYKVQGKYFKQENPEQLGLRKLNTDLMDPLAEVRLSKFAPMKMPKPPSAVDPERLKNAIKPFKAHEQQQQEDEHSELMAHHMQQSTIRVRSQSPINKKTVSKTGTAIKKAVASKPPTVTIPRNTDNLTSNTDKVVDVSGLELIGKPVVIATDVENLLEDDQFLISDHALAQREEVVTSPARLEDSIGIDSSTLEAIKHDEDSLQLLDSAANVSLLQLVEVGFGSAPPVSQTPKQRKQLGILNKQLSNKSLDALSNGDESPLREGQQQQQQQQHQSHTSHRPTVVAGKQFRNTIVDNGFSNSSNNSGGDVIDDARLSHHPHHHHHQTGIDSRKGSHKSGNGSGSGELDDAEDTVSRVEDTGHALSEMPSLSHYLNNLNEGSGTNASTRSMSMSISGSSDGDGGGPGWFAVSGRSATRSKSVAAVNSGHGTINSQRGQDDGMEQRHSHKSDHQSIATNNINSGRTRGSSTIKVTHIDAPANSSDANSNISSDGRISTPTLTFLAEAVKRNVTERYSPHKSPQHSQHLFPPDSDHFAHNDNNLTNNAQFANNRSTTVLALKESFDSKLLSQFDRIRRDQVRLRDLMVLSEGINGDRIGPDSAYLSGNPIDGSEPGSNPNVARTFKKKTPDFGPSAVRDAILLGKSFDIPNSGNAGNKLSSSLQQQQQFQQQQQQQQHQHQQQTNLSLNISLLDAVAASGMGQQQSSARSLGSASTDRSIFLGEIDPITGKQQQSSTAFPYARLPDNDPYHYPYPSQQSEGASIGNASSSSSILDGKKKFPSSDVNAEFLRDDNQSDAIMEAYAVMLNLPSNAKIVRQADGSLAVRVLSEEEEAAAAAAAGIVRTEASMDLSQSSFSQVDPDVPVVDPLAPPSPTATKMLANDGSPDGEEGGVNAPMSSLMFSDDCNSSVASLSNYSTSSKNDNGNANRSRNSSSRNSRKSKKASVESAIAIEKAMTDANLNGESNRPLSRGRSMIKASPVTSAGVLSASEVRYQSMMDFLRTRSANSASSAGPDNDGGGMSPLSTADAAAATLAAGRNQWTPMTPLTPMTAFGALAPAPALAPALDPVRARSSYDVQGMQALAYLDNEDLEFDLEREMRELIKTETLQSQQQRSSHPHRSSPQRNRRGGNAVSQSMSGMEITTKPLTASASADQINPISTSASIGGGHKPVKFPKITTSASANNLHFSANNNDIIDEKNDKTRKTQLDGMLLKEDPALVTITASTTKSNRKKQSTPIVSQFGEGLIGSVALKPNPKNNKSNAMDKLKYNIAKQKNTKQSQERDAKDDDMSVISNLTHDSNHRRGSREQILLLQQQQEKEQEMAARAKVDTTGNLVISLNSPSFLDDEELLFGTGPIALDRTSDGNLHNNLFGDRNEPIDDILSRMSGSNRSVASLNSQNSANGSIGGSNHRSSVGASAASSVHSQQLSKHNQLSDKLPSISSASR